MKLLYFFLLLFVPVFSCKKALSPEEIERQQLASMQKNIVNDWTIVKMMILKPDSLYGLEVGNFTCNDNQTFSFRSDSTFLYKGNPICGNKDIFPGIWNLPKTDSLFIRFDWNRIVCYENIKVAEISPRKMRWIMIAATGNGNPNDTVEYTLVPR